MRLTPKSNHTTHILRAPPASIDQTVSDFDGVIFHISTPETKTKILVSIQIRCFRDLVKYGAEQVLQREYGPYVVAPETGYDFSVQVDLENLPSGTNVMNAETNATSSLANHCAALQCVIDTLDRVILHADQEA